MLEYSKYYHLVLVMKEEDKTIFYVACAGRQVHLHFLWKGFRLSSFKKCDYSFFSYIIDSVTKKLIGSMHLGFFFTICFLRGCCKQRSIKTLLSLASWSCFSFLWQTQPVWLQIFFILSYFFSYYHINNDDYVCSLSKGLYSFNFTFTSSHSSLLRVVRWNKH